jgi:hypothetical protein
MAQSMRATRHSSLATDPPILRMPELKSDYDALTERVSGQLAASCPRLPAEVRIAFAAQIALAALRSEREVPIAVDLLEPHRSSR